MFEKDGGKLLNELEGMNLGYEFNFDDTYQYTNLLKNHIKGEVDSWAIRWYASAFLMNKYILYPRKTLVINIGYDKEGTNTNNASDSILFNSPLENNGIVLTKTEIKENIIAREAFKTFFKSLNPKLHKRIKNKLWQIKKRMF